jgi:hypothetical protein
VSYTRPFIAARFTAYAGDTRPHELFLAVRVIDSFTEEPPPIAISVRLKQLPLLVPTRNPSGFFCFEATPKLDPAPGEPREPLIPPGAYVLVFKPDRTTSDWYYLESNVPAWSDTFERAINLPKPDPKSPVEIATFVPKSSYPFPGNATLVRGKVMRGGLTNVEGAIVSTTYQREASPGAPPTPASVRTLTDREGEFVLFFKRLPSATQTITLTAAEGLIQVPRTVTITEGTTWKDVLFDLP